MFMSRTIGITLEDGKQKRGKQLIISNLDLMEISGDGRFYSLEKGENESDLVALSLMI